MTDTPYTNSHFQIQCLREALQRDEETLAVYIHDGHDRREIEAHAQKLRDDIAKLTKWETGRIRLAQTEAGGGNA